MLHEYHVIYSVRYYPRFHIIAVGLGTHYPRIQRHYCIVLAKYVVRSAVDNETPECTVEWVWNFISMLLCIFVDQRLHFG
jgi:hypothetical protein